MLVLTSLCWIAVSASADYRQKYPLPDLRAGSGWGVNIHFTDEKPGEVAQIAKAGFRWVRMDLFWHEIEREKGKYDFSAYDRLYASLDRHGLRPVFILDYGNDLYQKGSPRTPESRAAFCRFVEATMQRYQGRGALWEMWNEPNIFFWQPKPDVEEYIALATEVGKTIRRVAPEEWFVGPATSGFDWSFLQRCFDAGLLQHFDAVTIHPYRQIEPESVLTDWARLRRMIDAKAPAGKRIPMLSGEWGYSEVWSGMNAEKQADYVPRQYLSNLVAGVPLSIYYDWKDDGTDPKEAEHHFGTVYPDMRPKPAYEAVKRLAGYLDGYDYHLRIAQGPGNFVLAFRKGREARLVGWAVQGTGKATIDGKETALTSSPQPIEVSQAVQDRILALKPLPPFSALSAPETVKQLVQDVAGTKGESLVRVEDRLGGKVETKQELRVRNLPQTSISRFALPFLKDASTQSHTLRVEVDGIAQETEIQPILGMNLSLLPLLSDRVRVQIDNPSEKPLTGDLRVPVVTGTYVVKISLQAGKRYTDIDLPKLKVSTLEQTGPITLTMTPTGSSIPLKLTGSLRAKPLYTRPLDSGPLPAAIGSVVAEGDEKIAAKVGGSVVPAPAGIGTSVPVFRVAYDFAPGWRYVCLKPAGEAANPLSGNPVSLGMYVHGDGSGDLLRMRFRDSTGQTFQPDHGPIDWKGWKFVSFKLDGRQGGRWGGANDGVVHHPIRIETIALVDSLGGRGGKGEVLVAGPTVTFAR